MIEKIIDGYVILILFPFSGLFKWARSITIKKGHYDLNQGKRRKNDQVMERKGTRHGEAGTVAAAAERRTAIAGQHRRNSRDRSNSRTTTQWQTGQKSTVTATATHEPPTHHYHH